MPNEKKNLDKLARGQQRLPEQPRSHAEQNEAMWRCLLHIDDAAAFCEDRLKFNPDPWQKRLLRSRSKKIIVNVARQQGKSTTAAAKAVHRAVFWPGSLILIVAPAVPQAGELRRKIDEHLRNLKLETKTVADNKRELEFANGSRIIIVAADEDTVRSYTAHMIIEDEAAMVADPVYEAMEPMLLVTGGQHILLGTPKGMRKHHFADIWHDIHGKSEWDRYEVNAWQNPRVPREVLQALKDEKERLGRLWWFQQEYECSFVAAAQGLVYPYERKKNAVPTFRRDDRFWQYVLGIDYGFVDSTAFVVLGWQLDDPTVYVVESFEKRGLLAPEAAEIALAFTKKYPFARIVGDMGGFGKAYAEEARKRFKIPIQPAEKNNKRGYIELMASDMKAGLLKVFPGNAALVEEWQKLPWDEEREMPAEGYKDHLSDAALYSWREACHFLEEVRKAKPAKGSEAAYQLEADELFERRQREVLETKDWLDINGDAKWPELDQMTETSFLN